MTKRTTATAGLAILASITALSAAIPAHADNNTFLQQMHKPNMVFIAISDSQLLRLGYVACDVMQTKLDSGLPISNARSYSDQAVAQAAYAMGLESDRATTMHITEAAEDFLC